MGLFGFGKKNKDARKARERLPVKKVSKETAVEERTDRPTLALKSEGFSSVLLGPRITEKATHVSEHASVYTFNVSQDANKSMVSEAVTRLYKVNPRKVRIVTIPSKRVFVRGKRGVKTGGRKAYVYLKKGETIETT